MVCKCKIFARPQLGISKMWFYGKNHIQTTIEFFELWSEYEKVEMGHNSFFWMWSMKGKDK